MEREGAVRGRSPRPRSLWEPAITGLYERTQYHISEVKNKTQQAVAPGVEDQITVMEAEYQRLNEDLKSSFDEENKLHREIEKFSKDTLGEWDTLQQQHATDLQTLLKKQGVDLSEDFTEQMTEALKKQSSDLNETQWGELGIKQPASLTERTTISSLIKQWQTQNKDQKEIQSNVKKLRKQEPFKEMMKEHETSNKTFHDEKEKKAKKMRGRVQVNKTRKEEIHKKVEPLARKIQYFDLEYYPEPKVAEKKKARVAGAPAARPGEEGPEI